MSFARIFLLLFFCVRYDKGKAFLSFWPELNYRFFTFEHVSHALHTLDFIGSDKRLYREYFSFGAVRRKKNARRITFLSNRICFYDFYLFNLFVSHISFFQSSFRFVSSLLLLLLQLLLLHFRSMCTSFYRIV